MSYNKTNWKTGDVITADKLNNLEEAAKVASEKTIGYNFEKTILFNGTVEGTTARDDVVFSIVIENLDIPSGSMPVVILDNEEIDFIRAIEDDGYTTYYAHERDSVPSLEWTFAENKLKLRVAGDGSALTKNMVVYYETMVNISTAFKAGIMAIFD